MLTGKREKQVKSSIVFEEALSDQQSSIQPINRIDLPYPCGLVLVVHLPFLQLRDSLAESATCLLLQKY